MRIIWLGLIFICILSCSHDTPAPRSADLTQTNAEQRARNISNVHYDLDIDLRDREFFQANLKLRFEWQPLSDAIFSLDFFQGDVDALSVNGQPAQWQQAPGYIVLDHELLITGTNEISIDYRAPYSSTGVGLHQYIDATSGNAYLYTNLQPYAANHVLPSFDQPDLKARFSLRVQAPSDWQVISYDREVSVNVESDHRIWLFEASGPIPTYAFPLHAGPYELWQSDNEILPMRLFARAELADDVQADLWFKPSLDAFQYFERVFGSPSHFSKYDHIIVPQHPASAMEKYAAITWNEKFVTRSQPNQETQDRLAILNAHEMAHMWFGNWLTPRWWDDLWLNESLATLLSYRALASYSEQYPDIWQYFNGGTRAWGIELDRSVVTHAVRQPLQSTAQVREHFDGISYAKGAAILKQLANQLGDERFDQFLRQHLEQNAFANTNTPEFFDSVLSKSELTTEYLRWIEEPGIIAVQVDWACDGSQLSSVELKQTAVTGAAAFQNQSIELGLYRGGELIDRIPWQISETASTHQRAEAYKCPDFIYANEGELGYFQPKFNSQSIEYFRAYLSRIPAASTRENIWRALWYSVEDAELSLEQYLELVYQQLAEERDPLVIRAVADTLLESIDLLALWGDDRGTVERVRIAQFFQNRYLAEEPYSELRTLFARYFVNSAISADQFANVQTLLVEDNTEFGGVYVDQKLRWSVLLRLNQFAYGDYEGLLAEGIKSDSSLYAQQMSLAAEAARPNNKIKRTWLSALARGLEIPLSDVEIASQYLFSYEHLEQYINWENAIFDVFKTVSDARGEDYAKTYAQNLIPYFCNEGSSKKLAKVMRAYESENAIHQIFARKLEQNQRCMAIKALSRRG